MPIVELESSKESTGDWEAMAKQAKALENDLDTSFLTLSRLTSAALRSGRNSTFQSDADALIVQIESKLANLMENIESMARVNALPSSSHLVQRHRDIYMDYVKELRKARTHLSACLQPSQESGPNEHLLKESDQIAQVSGLTEHVIKYDIQITYSHLFSMAQTSQKNLLGQRSMLYGTFGRVESITDRFPALNQLLLRIRVRRRRDTMIVLALILFLFYLALKYSQHSKQ